VVEWKQMLKVFLEILVFALTFGLATGQCWPILGDY